MFVTSISFRGTLKSFWYLTEVSEQSWYKVLTYEFSVALFLLNRYWGIVTVPGSFLKAGDLG